MSEGRWDSKAVTEVLRSLLTSQTQDRVREIEQQLVSRGLQHISPDTGVPFPIAITVVPTPVKYTDYLAVEELQPALNLLLDRLSKDKEFIVSNLSPIAEHDPLAKGLLDIYMSLPSNHSDKITLGLHRHDFMYGSDDPRAEAAFLNGQFKLVEFNFIASSLGSLTEGTYHYHRTLLNRHNVNTASFNDKVNIVNGYADGLRTAHSLYDKMYECNGQCVVVLVQDEDQFNYFDQQLILNGLESAGVRTVRYTTRYIVDHGTTRDGRYYLDNLEVAVFYFRVMYDPSHYPTPEYWETRRQMELSAAISVPCVRHQIVNMKLFQMLISQRSVLERYSDCPETTERVLDLLHDTLPLNLDEDGDRNAQLGIDHPSLYVLKPQREGGGHNLWDEEMRDELISLAGDASRSQYILMKKITPPVLTNKIVKHGVMSEEMETVSEIGFYSVYCTEGDTVLHNRVVGPLVRTKSRTENEGGVAVGISALDSPFFV